MKFTIRDLFLVTVIVALVLGWWVDRSRLSQRAREAEVSAGLEREVRKFLKSMLEDEGYRFSRDQNGRVSIAPPKELPSSQAPAPNPPKNQSATNVDP